MSFFDNYEIRARLIPAALIASPLLLPLFAFDLVSASMSTALGSAIVVVLLYLFSHVIAFLGRRSEPALWQSWGGIPSSIVLTDSDKTFPASTKQAICKAVLDVYTMDLDAVAGNAEKWREQAKEGFRLIRQYLRQHDPKGVWSVQNAEYGALRNILASAGLFAAFSGIAAASCAIAWWMNRRSLPAMLAIVAIVMLVAILIVRSTILPKVARSIAFRYAETAWLCFLNLSKTEDTISKGGSD